MQSEDPVCELAAVELLNPDKSVFHIARFLPSVQESDAPFLFVWQVLLLANLPIGPRSISICLKCTTCHLSLTPRMCSTLYRSELLNHVEGNCTKHCSCIITAPAPCKRLCAVVRRSWCPARSRWRTCACGRPTTTQSCRLRTAWAARARLARTTTTSCRAAHPSTWPWLGALCCLCYCSSSQTLPHQGMLIHTT